MIDSLAYGFWRQVPSRQPQYNLTVVTPPVAEPVSYTELADHLRLDETTDQPLVTALGTAARQYVETATKLTFVATTYDVSFDYFDSCGIRLPRRPVTNVASVKYRDQSGTTQTLDASLWTWDQKGVWSTIRPAPGTAFPLTDLKPNAVTIRFTAGTSPDAAGVSELPKLVIKQLAAAYYENREAVTGDRLVSLPLAAEAIMWQLAAPEV